MAVDAHERRGGEHAQAADPGRGGGGWRRAHGEIPLESVLERGRGAGHIALADSLFPSAQFVRGDKDGGGCHPATQGEDGCATERTDPGCEGGSGCEVQ